MYIRVTAVPGDELRRGDAPRESLALNAESPVASGAVRVDRGVNHLPQLLDLQIRADADVPVEAHLRTFQGPLQCVADGSDRLMIRCDAIPDEAKGHWQPVDDHDFQGHLGLLDERFRGIDPGRPCSNNRDD